MSHLPSARELLTSDRPLVIAHRGNSSVAPENTLPAFHAAVELGVDMVELDYAHSADGMPIVFHDLTLDRLTNAREVWPKAERRIPLSSKTCSELLSLDAGSWFSPDFVGTRLFTLAEILGEVSLKTCVAIERKSGDPATLLATLTHSQTMSRVVVMAFDWYFLAELHAHAPELPLVALGKGKLTEDCIADAIAVGASAIGWDNHTLDLADIARVHKHGLKLWCWTVDEPARAGDLLQSRIDGLISNVPAVMLAARAG